MATEKDQPRLNLTVSVLYDLKGESLALMEHNLRSAAQDAFGEGQLTGSTEAEVESYTIEITGGEEPTPPNLLDAGRGLASALADCLEQISQMRGMFDDNDGAIQQAVDEADGALDAWNEAAPKQEAPAVDGPSF